MKTKVEYEWCWEQIDASGEIQDHHHAKTLAELSPRRPDQYLCLIRDEFKILDNGDADLFDRTWAGVTDDVRLESRFKQSGGQFDELVPKRFHEELKSHSARLYPDGFVRKPDEVVE